MVAAVQHAGDSFDDASAFGTDRAMLGRAYQLSALLDAVLMDPFVGPHVDPSRVGVAGFSAGGYTALLAVGAKPDFSLGKAYCERHPGDREICSVKELKRTLSNPKPTADRRIQAAFVMAPLGVFFGARAFDEVRAPVYLAWAQRDRVLLPEENAERVRQGMARLAGAMEIPEADHFVFLAPCTEGLAIQAPMLCEDPPGVDRAQVHRQLAEEARRFFDEALGR